jgi:hypothetical protein
VAKAFAEKGYLVTMLITKLRASIVVSLKAFYKWLMNIVKQELSNIFAGVPVNQINQF